MKNFIKRFRTWISQNWKFLTFIIFLICVTGIVGYLKGLDTLLAPIVGLIALWIAYQQWRTNQQKLDIELYDRRLRIYIEIKTFFRKIIANADVKTDDIVNLWESTVEVDFIFSPKIRKLINEINSHASQYKSWKEQFKDLNQPKPQNYNPKEITDGMRKESDWFIEQFEPATNLFKEEMRLFKIML